MFAAVRYVGHVERLQNLGELCIQRKIARLLSRNFGNLFVELSIQIPTVESIARLHGIRQCNCRAFGIAFRVSVHAAIRYVRDVVYFWNLGKFRIKRNIARLVCKNFRYFIDTCLFGIPTNKVIAFLCCIRKHKPRTFRIRCRVRMFPTV